jgi:opacity protein-like surface antigen
VQNISLTSGDFMPSTQLLVAVLLALLSTVATAKDSPWYAGVSGGESRTGHELVTNRESTIVRATDLHTDFDARDNAWKAFGGYRFNDMLAVEINYANLGRHSTFTTMVALDMFNTASTLVKRKITGYGADLLLCAPIGNYFSVFGRVGAFRSRLVADAQLDGLIEFTSGNPLDRARSTTVQETVLRYGVGGDWWFRPNLALRVEWERYSNVGKAFAIGGSGTTGEANTDGFFLGVMARF